VRSILVVEDDAALRRMICRVLLEGGFRPLPAEGGSAGLEVVERANGDIALAILDMVMPGMSGLDLAADLSRRYPTVTILYISGHVESLAMHSIAQLTPKNVLLKPFTGKVLIQRVNSLLDSPRC
jgi:DNA-binding response OmpR family regulator